jgi:hypothetical protein
MGQIVSGVASWVSPVEAGWCQWLDRAKMVWSQTKWSAGVPMRWMRVLWQLCEQSVGAGTAATMRAAARLSLKVRRGRRSPRHDVRVSRLSEEWLQSYESDASKHSAEI